MVKNTRKTSKQAETSDATSFSDGLKKSLIIGTGPISGGVVKPSKETSSKKRTDKAIEQFVTSNLPALKKEMARRRKEDFQWDNYAKYFKPDSKYLATFVLPLFKFLEKTEIVCVRYGCFDNRHMVKTTAGFERVMLLSRHCSEDDLPADVQQYITQRFGKEWFKIPSKDGFRAKAAAAAGHEGAFKVVLTGIFEDSFVDNETGQTILTVNPSLSYEPVRPPVVKKEKEKKEKKDKKKKVDEIPIGAQEVELELLEPNGGGEEEGDDEGDGGEREE